jgi:hypothetical protein
MKLNLNMFSLTVNAGNKYFYVGFVCQPTTEASAEWAFVRAGVFLYDP